MQEEVWKPVVGFEAYYEVSSLGRVRSIPRLIKHPKIPTLSRLVGGRVLTPLNAGTRYPKVFLSVDGVMKGKKIHRLVAEAFLPNPDTLPEINHINGVRCDNRVSNLEWCTRAANMRHAVDSGLKPPNLGEKHGMSILTTEQVLEIRRRRQAGESGRSVAAAFGITPTMVSRIHLRKNWRHI